MEEETIYEKIMEDIKRGAEILFMIYKYRS